MVIEELVHFSHIWKQLGGRQILHDVSLTVEKGDIFGFLGPNGAGKTTSIRIMLGLLRADSGDVSILGASPDEDDVRSRIGFVLEADGLYDGMTAYDNLAYYARIYAVAKPESRIDAMLQLAGLGERARDKVGTFSKGMRQRLALGRAMLHDPDLLILDEPTAGVDPAGQVDIRQALLTMVQDDDKSILLSSHNLDEVQRICNRVALINRGVVRLQGDLAQLERERAGGEARIRTAEPLDDALLGRVKDQPGVTNAIQANGTLTLRVADDDVLSAVVTMVAAAGARIKEVSGTGPGLEELYLNIVREEGQDEEEPGDE
jgi:ABC-2 type transport system ATP-binding protein